MRTITITVNSLSKFVNATFLRISTLVAIVIIFSGCGSDDRPDAPRSEDFLDESQLIELENNISISTPPVYFEGLPTQVNVLASPENQPLLGVEGSGLETINKEDGANFTVLPVLQGDQEYEFNRYQMSFGDRSDGLPTTASWERPVFQYPIELGGPLTLRSGTKFTIGASLSHTYLESEDDEFAKFSWAQHGGPALEFVDKGEPNLEVVLPSVTSIEKIELYLTAISEQQKWFVKSKTLFVVPEDAWTEALVIDQSPRGAAAVRADGSIVILDEMNEVSFSSSPFDSVKQIEKGYTTWVISDEGDMRWFDEGQWQLPENSLPQIEEVFAVFGDAREPMKVVDTNHDLYTISPFTSNGTIQKEGSDVKAVSPRVTVGAVLKTNGDLFSPQGELIKSDIVELSNHIFLDSQGRVGNFDYDGVIQYIEKFMGYGSHLKIASSKSALARFPYPVYALQDNGEVLGFTPAAPMVSTDLNDIKDIDTSGTVGMALKQDGTVIQWPTSIRTSSSLGALLGGDIPSPFNVKEGYYTN